MNHYRIKITKHGNSDPLYRIVTSPSLKEAEYFAIEILLLAPRHVSIDDHFKLGHTPFAKSIKRTNDLSQFEFKSYLLSVLHDPIKIEIQKDNQAKSKTTYDRGHEATIFDIWPYEAHHEEEQKKLSSAPQFFTPEDLAYFSSVAGTKPKRYGSEFMEIAERLTRNGIFDKTAYWAQKMREFGFTAEFRNDWKFKGIIQTYSWARVFPAKKSPKIFFTIGVGTHSDNSGGQVASLEFKLDRQYNGLSPEEEQLFDSYIANSGGDAPMVRIEGSELSSLNWDLLAEHTRDFIIANDHHYWSIRRLLEGENDPRKVFARVCWSTEKWMFPSGPEGKSKSAAATHEKDRGYGYEEWLFNTTKQIDGYHYTFLQAFHKGDHFGKKYDIKLYSFHHTEHGANQYWIGELENVEVLRPQHSREIVAEYKVRGWYDEMIHQLQEINLPGFDFTDVAEDQMFNIRFKVESETVLRYEEPIPVPYDQTIGNQHYTITDREDVKPKIHKDPFEGSDEEEVDDDTQTETTIKASYQGQERVMKFLHLKMQKCIRKQLMSEYRGTGKAVTKEFPTDNGTSIDLVVKDVDESLTLYEIKTAITPILCIREALGQLLEYNFFYNKASEEH